MATTNEEQIRAQARADYAAYMQSQEQPQEEEEAIKAQAREDFSLYTEGLRSVSPEIITPEKPKRKHPMEYFGMAYETTKGVPEEIAKGVIGIPEAAVRTAKTFTGGLTLGFKTTADALDFYSNQLAQLGEKHLGIPADKLRSGLFQDLSEDWGKWSERLKAEGVQIPVLKDIIETAGHSAATIGQIMTMGSAGLPIYGAITGGPEGGVKGAIVGGIAGGLMHGIIRGISNVPSGFRLPAWAGFGAVTTPGEPKERLKGAIDWTLLGLAGKGRKITTQEFLLNYPRLLKGMAENKALKIMKNLDPTITKEQVKAEGGAVEVLNKTFEETAKWLKEEKPEVETPKIKEPPHEAYKTIKEIEIEKRAEELRREPIEEAEIKVGETTVKITSPKKKKGISTAEETLEKMGLEAPEPITGIKPMEEGKVFDRKIVEDAFKRIGYGGELEPEHIRQLKNYGLTEKEIRARQEAAKKPLEPTPEEKAELEKPKVELEPEWFAGIKEDIPDWFKEWGIKTTQYGKAYERIREQFNPAKAEKGLPLKEQIRNHVLKQTGGEKPFISKETGEMAEKPEKATVPLPKRVSERGIEEELVRQEEGKPIERKVEEAATSRAFDFFEAKIKDPKKKQAFGYMRQGLSYRAAAKKVGVSHDTIDKWFRTWRGHLKEKEAEFMKVKEEAKRDLMEEVELEEVELKKHYSGYPVTEEVARAIKTVREKLKTKRKIKLDELKTELQKTDKGKVEWMLLDTDRQLKELRKPSFKKAYAAAKRALVDTSGNVKTKMLKEMGDLGKEATIQHDLIAGASGKADAIYEKAAKGIYSGLSKSDGALLDGVIQVRRSVAISKYKPEHKHPGGLKTKEHAAYLKDVPKEVDKRADLYFKEMERVLDELKAEGLIDAEAHENLKSKGDYSPRRFIQHIDPEGAGIDALGRKITVPDSGIKALDEGSYNVMEKNSRLLLESVISRTQARIFKNRANKAAYNIAENIPDNGIFIPAKVLKVVKPEAQKVLETMEVVEKATGKPIYAKAPAGHTKIKAMINGKVKEIIMPDEFAREWVTRDPLINQQMANLIGWVSGSKALKPMATGYNPGFAITNFPRDIAHVYLVTSEYSSFLPKFTLQMGRDLEATKKDAFTRKGAWLDYIDEGGSMSFLTHQGRLFKTNIKGIKEIQQTLGYPGETSEIWTRLALRRRALINGKSPHEATWIARNYLDFNQGGSVAKAFDKGIPYLNASIQGTRGIFRALADRPVQTLWKFANIGALATGLYLANKYMNPKALEQVSDRDKVNNFIITTPFSFTDKNGNERYLYFKIAKDQGQRVIATLFESLMGKALGEPVNGDQVAQSIQEFLPIIPSQNIPPSLDAMLGYFANKDFWTNQEIWRGDKITPREEYTDYTHPAFVKAGKVTGLSPERLSYSLSQFFTRGNIYTSLVGGGLTLVMKDQPKDIKRQTTEEMVTKLPIIKRIAKVTPYYSEADLKRLDKVKTEESTRRYKQRRELGTMSKQYYNKLYDEKVKDKELMGEIKAFIRKQPQEDKQRLVDWFLRYGKIYNISNRVWWLNLAEMPPEARATVFWTKWLQSDADGKKEMNRTAHKISGFYSTRFLERLVALKNKAK